MKIRLAGQSQTAPSNTSYIFSMPKNLSPKEPTHTPKDYSLTSLPTEILLAIYSQLTVPGPVSVPPKKPKFLWWETPARVRLIYSTAEDLATGRAVRVDLAFPPAVSPSQPDLPSQLSLALTCRRLLFIAGRVAVPDRIAYVDETARLPAASMKRCAQCKLVWLKDGYHSNPAHWITAHPNNRKIRLGFCPGFIAQYARLDDMFELDPGSHTFLDRQEARRAVLDRQWPGWESKGCELEDVVEEGAEHRWQEELRVVVEG